LAYACIDVGSNTTRLLVAEPHADWLRVLHMERAFTRLGADLVADGGIGPAKLAETARAVAEQVALARELDAGATALVGTAAIREAANRGELVTALEDAAGLPMRVLSDEEEARLSFDGATRGTGLDGSVAVADVGGGSTELAVGSTAHGVAWFASFRIGSGVLADLHLLSDPPAQAELEAVRERARETFAGLEPPPADHAIAVGGSATSLRRLVGPTIDPDTLARSAAVLSATPIAEAAARLDLEPERVRLLPAGMAILAELVACVGRPLEVGRGGLREGVILELADRDSGEARPLR
jgi:exopolyphosphatase/guanosine-5'-triphosphate,3'-diphosphate pyrophosphatase